MWAARVNFFVPDREKLFTTYPATMGRISERQEKEWGGLDALRPLLVASFLLFGGILILMGRFFALLYATI